MTIGFQPAGDNVLVHIVLPAESEWDESVEWAEVIAVGPGRRTADGVLMVPDLAPGDRIALRPRRALHLRIDGEPLAVAASTDILGLLLPEKRRPRPTGETASGAPPPSESQARAFRDESLETDMAPDLLDQQALTGDDLH